MYRMRAHDFGQGDEMPEMRMNQGYERIERRLLKNE